MFMPLFALFLLCHGANAVALRTEASTLSKDNPRDDPYPELLEPGFKYAKPPGTGCDSDYDPKLDSKKPAIDFLVKKPDGTTAWNGFCQMGWTACPDAVANRDYNYYAKSLGVPWIEGAGFIDKSYCHNAGFLEPEIAVLRNNFTALHDKAEELCRTTFTDPKYKMNKVGVDTGVMDAMIAGTIDNIFNWVPKVQQTWASGNMLGAIGMLLKYDFLPEEAAHIAGAWNCALGDLGCDLAYCNWAYCLKPDGSVGTSTECEGWDPIHGNKLPEKH